VVDEQTIETDVLVCGGGPSGMAAATLAARGGAKVLLAEAGRQIAISCLERS